MDVITINGKNIVIDIESELREYDFGYNARWSEAKLIASSPFRSDYSPSFFVNLTGEYAGTWADSGAIDPTQASGNFVSLIAGLRGLTYNDAAEYLLEKYDPQYCATKNESIRLARIRTRRPTTFNYIDNKLIKPAISPYLLSRGISEEAQRSYGVGYNPSIKRYTAIPWRSPAGKLAAIKYRSTAGKHFFYERGGTSINRLVYGIDLAGNDAVICEGEIDALSWVTAGTSGIAVAGVSLSGHQIDILRRSNIKRLYVGGDNDEQGQALNAAVKRAMRGYVELFEIDYGKYKDANDVITAESVYVLRELINDARPIRSINLRL